MIANTGQIKMSINFNFCRFWVHFLLIGLAPLCIAQVSISRDPPPSYTSACKISYLSKTNNRVLCEARNGLSVDCLDPSVKKVYIQCGPAYFFKDNVNQQIIQCLDNGTWSEPAAQCVPKCSDKPQTIEFMDLQTISYPASYIEFVQKGSDIKDPIRFPAIILNEGYVVTLEENYPLYITDVEFIAKIPKSTGTIEIPITPRGLRTTSRSKDGIFLFIELYAKYIEFDDDTKPVCNILQIEGYKKEYANDNVVFGLQQNWDRGRTEHWKSCIVPKLQSSKTEVQCFKIVDLDKAIVPPAACSSSNGALVTRCKIGFQNNKQKNIESLSVCRYNSWRTYGDDSNCKMTCGLTAAANPVSPLIFRGKETDIVSAPWHVGIFANNTGTRDYQQVCGGSIIHSNIVLSAAHCFYDDSTTSLLSESNYLVGGGKRFRSFDISETYDYYIKIKKIVIPFNYQNSPIRNDISILFLQNHFDFTTHIRPICIDWSEFDDDTSEAGNEGRLVGWGATTSDGISSQKLLETHFKTITNEECRKLVDPNYRKEIAEGRFCATNDRNSSACGGDSGGGFVIQKELEGEVRNTLIGIVSAGLNVANYCADGFVTVFTSIQHHKDFIRRAITQHRNEPVAEYLANFVEN